MAFAQRKQLAGLVTIDVEPDNVWADTHSQQYENIRRLPLFHDLCRDYQIRPTYLVSWSIASNAVCVGILEGLLRLGDCEIGIHPHLWETPPFTDKDGTNRATVGPDYSEDILQEKIASLVDLISQRFGQPSSHRAGRWGIDPRQVHILTDLGIRVDSSVIPGIDWSSTGILDHSRAPLEPYFIGDNDIFARAASGLLEVPCTIKPGFRLLGLERNRYVAKLIAKVGHGSQWLRATPRTTTRQMIQTCQWVAQHTGHLNLMSHSSELMANGSPYWKTEADIVHHFSLYRELFRWWRQHDVEPMTLSEFATTHDVATRAQS